jgi:hypothetical protein
MFTELCGGELKPFIAHPNNSDRKLFFLFDSVHLIKCVRNNWLSQKDADQTFVYPCIVDDSVAKACFLHVRQLFNSEKDNIVKLAPNLTYKSLYPSSIERQNVKLALKVFDERTAVALVHFGRSSKTDLSGYNEFISLIVKLWKILNVKSPDKGAFKRDQDSFPIKELNDSRLTFLRDFHTWLCKWDNLPKIGRQGCLSAETMFALKHIINTILELVPYLLNELHLSYVLLEKFHTDVETWPRISIDFSTL